MEMPTWQRSGNISQSQKQQYPLKRETDPANRRNLIITITASGMDILRQKDLEAEMRMEKIILRFGKEETLQFIQLISKMNETMKTLQEE